MIQAIGDKILVQKYKLNEHKTKVGIYLVSVLGKTYPKIELGKVISISKESKKKITNLTEGEYIVYEPGADTMYQNIDDLYFIRYMDVLAIIKLDTDEDIQEFLLNNIKAYNSKKI